MYSYGYQYRAATTAAELQVILPIVIITSLFSLIASLVVTYILTHKVYEKAGYSKWVSIIPFYNYYVLYKMAGINVGFFVLSLFFPVVNIYLFIELAQKFGKSAGFGVAMFFFSPIFLAILGYGEATFTGEKHSPAVPAQPTSSPESE